MQKLKVECKCGKCDVVVLDARPFEERHPAVFCAGSVCLLVVLGLVWILLLSVLII